MTQAQAPVIVLAIRKAEPYKDCYLPEGKWSECLSLYYEFFDKHHLKFYEYDFQETNPFMFLDIEQENLSKIDYWVPMWKAGNAMGGNTLNPRILICAQNLGPSNLNNIVFECGPTGSMMSEMLAKTNTPLNDIAITNLVKAPRGTMRPPNEEDLKLFHIELEHTRPQKVIFMGSVAKFGIKVAKNLGIAYDTIEHLGYHYHHGTRNMSEYHIRWMQMLDMIPDYTF